MERYLHAKAFMNGFPHLVKKQPLMAVCHIAGDDNEGLVRWVTASIKERRKCGQFSHQMSTPLAVWEYGTCKLSTRNVPPKIPRCAAQNLYPSTHSPTLPMQSYFRTNIAFTCAVTM